MNLEITNATEQDSQVLANMLTEAAQYKVIHGDMAWGTEPFSSDEVNHYLSRGTVYIAYLNGKPIGTFSLRNEDTRVWGERQTPAMYLHRLAIISSQHRKGIGQLLLKRSELETIKAGIHTLRLDCDEKNVQLCMYYERSNFLKVGNKRLVSDMGEYTAALYEKEI
jgi:GNAT superfamily N-acetyltransferase